MYSFNYRKSTVIKSKYVKHFVVNIACGISVYIKDLSVQYLPFLFFNYKKIEVYSYHHNNT